MELDPKIVESLNNGEKVAAIKQLRQLQGLSLAEAKGMVEVYADEHNIEFEDSGTAGKFFGVFALFLMLVYFIFELSKTTA